MIQCRLCNLQYIGETKRRLKDRFNEHRRPVRLNPTSNYIYTAVSEHFLSNNHSDTHMLLILLKNLIMNAILLERHVRLTLFTRLRLLSL